MVIISQKCQNFNMNFTWFYLDFCLSFKVWGGLHPPPTPTHPATSLFNPTTKTKPRWIPFKLPIRGDTLNSVFQDWIWCPLTLKLDITSLHEFTFRYSAVKVLVGSIIMKNLLQQCYTTEYFYCLSLNAFTLSLYKLVHSYCNGPFPL
jgi:hypothetical protein